MSDGTGPIVLVHGAWGSASSWGPVADALRAMGREVHALDLPGHGSSPVSASGIGQFGIGQFEIGLSDYAEHIAAALAPLPPALLVGPFHGWHGHHRRRRTAPERIRKLVYLCAFLPKDGDSLLSLIRQQDSPGIQPAIRRTPGANSTILDPDIAAPILCQDADPATLARVKATLGPQPNAAQTDPVHLTKASDRLPRAYIQCNQDRTILPALQQKMLSQRPCDPVHQLETGHMPQLTAPDQVAALLNAL